MATKIKIIFEFTSRIFTIQPIIKGVKMNRKKKINSILKKRMKKINAKLAPDSKPKYVSKAERAKIAEQQDAQTTINPTD